MWSKKIHLWIRRRACGNYHRTVVTMSDHEIVSNLNDKDKDRTTTNQTRDDEMASCLTLKPREVVSQLDQYIVGQKDAKRAVAIALRNRWRRHHVPDDLRMEISPKNILMIGPTGCGKTEIARRLAKCSQAPFVKVEATKYTEVGFHGRDVDQILQNLVDNAIHQCKQAKRDTLRAHVQTLVEKRLLDGLAGQEAGEESRATFLTLLRARELEDRTIDISHPSSSSSDMDVVVDMDGSSQNPMKDLAKLAQTLKAKSGSFPPSKRSMTIAEARPWLEELEMDQALDMQEITRESLRRAESHGIVFIDEIDKVVSSGEFRGADASSEGVQRDLLPLMEGSTIQTKHGNLETDHILFIASGAFHGSKPSDLLAELQGRLPIRVELKALTEEDLYRILHEPVNNLIRQQVELLATEDVTLTFTSEATREIAKVAYELNRTVENIGARRLHTVLERVVEEVSFNACDLVGQTVVIDQDFVLSKVRPLMEKSDLTKFIL